MTDLKTLPEEDELLNDLANVWNKYAKMDRLEREQVNEFAEAIHRLQGLVIVRAYLREYSKNEIGDNNG